MRKPSRRIRTEPAPGADPSPAGGAPFLDSAPRDELPGDGTGGDDLVAARDDDGDGLDVLADEAPAGNRERLEAERPPHYA